MGKSLVSCFLRHSVYILFASFYSMLPTYPFFSSFLTYPSLNNAGLSGRVVSASDYSVRGPMFESRR